MLLTLFLWIWITVFCYIYGEIAVDLLCKIFKFEKRERTTLPVLLILGICVLGIIAMYFSILLKVGLTVNIILIIIALIYIIFKRKILLSSLKAHILEVKKISAFSAASFFIISLIILFETSVYIPKNFDTALYHAQAIHWIEEYKAVPGLGNFHRNLAYDNSWFLPSALFSFSFLKIQSFHVLNGIFLLFGTFYFLSVTDEFFRKKNTFSGLISIFVLPIAIFLYTNFSSSPATDMPNSIIIWVIFILLASKIEERQLHEFSLHSVIIVILSSFLITIKLSGAPLFLFVIYIIMYELISGKKRALTLILICTLIILPWIIRNVIISGYAVYPVLLTGIFNVDWKIPDYSVLSDITGIKIWSFPIDNLPVYKYMPLWLKGLNIQYRFVIWPLFMLSLSSLLYYLTLLILNTKKLGFLVERYNCYLICYIIAFVGTIFLFYTAPDVRYGAGLFSVFSILVFLPVLASIMEKHKNLLFLSKIYPLLLIIFIIAFEIFLFNRYFYAHRDLTFLRDNISDIKKRILIPADYGKSQAGVTEYSLGKNFKFFVPNVISARCWYDPFPSTAEINRGLELRTGNIEDGFRIKKP